MTKLSPTRYRTTNRSDCNGALRKRGSLLIRLDRRMAWHAPHEVGPGRPPAFSDAAIQFRLSIEVLFKLPLRQAAGMVSSLLRMAGLDWPAPDCSTLCRRRKTLKVQIPYRRADGPLNLLVDSTGVKFPGDGALSADCLAIACREINGRRASMRVQGRRQGRRVHPAMDTATSDIRAVEFTPGREGDSPVLPELLDRIPEDERIGTVTADGACDTRRRHAAIMERDALPIIPIRKNGRPWKEDRPATRVRNETSRATRHYGRAFWKRWTGYHVRSRVEANPFMVCRQTTAGRWMRCLKAFAERIAASDPDRQTAEIHIRIALMNRFNALGTAETVRMA